MTFYGQLAAATANPRGNLTFPVNRGTAASKQAFMDQSVMQAMQALADVGAQGTLRTFAIAAADTFTDRDQFVFLTTFLRGLNEPALALRVAKRGLQKNVPIYDIAYPTVSLPVYRGNGTAPESALVLGLTRQESEFDPEAMSGAGARGLMQMMPATAKITARKHGINFGNKTELFTPSVNVQLGMAHVSDLLKSFGGSYVLSIASYNAGAGRANQWMSTYGDPRSTNADVVDWIERIPFNETRNYVQRVLENTQVYRNILAGRDTPLVIADRPEARRLHRRRRRSGAVLLLARADNGRGDRSNRSGGDTGSARRPILLRADRHLVDAGLRRPRGRAGGEAEKEIEEEGREEKEEEKAHLKRDHGLEHGRRSRLGLYTSFLSAVVKAAKAASLRL